MSGKLKVLSLFAGIGGFDLGLERTGGFETVAVAETDAYASKVLSLRFPNAANVGDVTTAEYPNADIICAGFPCQDISFAGAGAGLAGARSGLWREVVRAIRVVRPQYAILENVAALLSRGLGTVLGDLAEIGHDAEWHCISASAVGAPHRRDRIWIVANPGSEQHEGCRAPLSGEIAAELSRANQMGDGGRSAGERVTGSVLATESGEHCPGQQHGAEPLGFEYASSGGRGGLVADPIDARSPRPGREPQHQGEIVKLGDGNPEEAAEPNWWSAEPDVGRVAHGIPKRVDRLRCLGNAVVPQIPELIGRAILAIAGEARSGETVQQGSTGTASTRAERHRPESPSHQHGVVG